MDCLRAGPRTMFPSGDAALGRCAQDYKQRMGRAMAGMDLNWVGLCTAAALLAMTPKQVLAQDACPSRGQLDTLYCDAQP